MFKFHAISILLVAHASSGQIFGPFEPFPPVPPPPFFMFYTFPPVTLQARLGGGLQASIPDDCGIESFEFESRKKPTSEWNGGNVTTKTEGNWIFEDPLILLAPGETLFYRCRIKQRGSYITNPDAEWVVPDELATEFDPPKPPKKTKECDDEVTTPKSDETTKKPPKSNDKPKKPQKPEDKKTTTLKPDERKEETTAKPDEDATTEPEESAEKEEDEEKEEKKPEKKKSPENMKTEEEKETKTPECPAPRAKPGETREEALERKLWKVQCDMIQLAERSFKLNEALSYELTELKKLNYVVVTRIQRLESLLRNLNRPVPFPSPFY